MLVPHILLPNEHWLVRLVMRLPVLMFHIEYARLGRDTESHSVLYLWCPGLLKRLFITRPYSVYWMLRYTNKTVYRAIIDGLFN